RPADPRVSVRGVASAKQLGYGFQRDLPHQIRTKSISEQGSHHMTENSSKRTVTYPGVFLEEVPVDAKTFSWDRNRSLSPAPSPWRFTIGVALQPPVEAAICQ